MHSSNTPDNGTSFVPRFWQAWNARATRNIKKPTMAQFSANTHEWKEFLKVMEDIEKVETSCTTVEFGLSSTKASANENVEGEHKSDDEHKSLEGEEDELEELPMSSKSRNKGKRLSTTDLLDFLRQGRAEARAMADRDRQIDLEMLEILKDIVKHISHKRPVAVENVEVYEDEKRSLVRVWSHSRDP